LLPAGLRVRCLPGSARVSLLWGQAALGPVGLVMT